MTTIVNTKELKVFIKGCERVARESTNFEGGSSESARAIIVASLMNAYFDGSMTQKLFNSITEETKD